MSRRRAPAPPKKLDLAGVLLLPVGLTAFALGCDRVGRWGATDLRALALLGIALVALAVFAAVELRTPDPVVNLRLLKNPTIWAAMAALAVMQAASFAVTVFVDCRGRVFNCREFVLKVVVRDRQGRSGSRWHQPGLRACWPPTSEPPDSLPESSN